jgi:molybdopterin molybdotransferase
MITFEEAYRIVTDHTRDFGITKIPLLDSVDRVLRESWKADRDFPPFDRVMMDGIAIHYDKQSL